MNGMGGGVNMGHKCLTFKKSLRAQITQNSSECLKF